MPPFRRDEQNPSENPRDVPGPEVEPFLPPSVRMLRIVTERQGEACTLSLHGRLAEEWVELVGRHWQSMLETIPAANVTVSLSDVSFVDTEGERLLERMWRHGSRLVASGCMNRHVIDTIRARTRTAQDRRTGSLHDATPQAGSES